MNLNLKLAMQSVKTTTLRRSEFAKQFVPKKNIFLYFTGVLI